METSTNGTLREARWAARPRAAAAVRLASFLAPFATSIVASMVVRRLLPTPHGWGEAVFVWVVVTVAATAAVVLTDRVTRRLLPVAALLKLSLTFPDEAPSRFRTALRTGTVAQLERRLDALREEGFDGDAGRAAREMIDLVAALNRHDRLTRGHSERVRAYARLIGEELGYDEAKLDLLNWAALCHDIGKLAIPSEILTKPGALTAEEYDLVKTHPVEGAKLIYPLRDWLGPWAHAVLEHHERWDGQGYPAGLAGEDISIAARIVSVADVFDVITSARSYKEPVSADEARKEIARCSGTYFDPTVVRAFLNVGMRRLRLVMGPLAWLSQIGYLRPVPLAPVGASVAGAVASLTVVAASAFGASTPPPPKTPEVAIITTADAPVGFDAAGPSDPTTTSTAPRSSSSGGRGPAAGASGGGGSGSTPGGTAASGDTGDGDGMPAPGTAPGVPNDGASVVDDAVTIHEDQVAVVDVLANDTGVGLIAVGQPRVGAATVAGGRVLFVPPPDWSGVAVVQYLATTPFGRLLGGNVFVEVVPVPDAPDATIGRTSTFEDVPVVLPVPAGDVDADGDPVTIVAVDDPARGSATFDGTTLTYVPDRDTNGTDVVVYDAADPGGLRTQRAIVVDVVPVNDAPIVKAGPIPITSDDAGPVELPGWLDASPGPLDEAGQALTMSLRTDRPDAFAVAPALDPATGTLRFTPAHGAGGAVTLTVTVTDDGGTADGGADTTVVRRSFSLRAGNDAPVPAPDPHATVAAGSAVVVDVVAGATDPEGDTVTVVSVADPAHGTATTDGRSITYWPDGGWSGPDTFTYVLADAHGARATGSLTVTTSTANRPPQANPDAFTVPEDDPGRTLDVLANDSDPDGGPLHVTALSTGAFDLGTVTLGGDGTITFVPDPDRSGTATFGYTVADATGATDSDAVTVTVTPVADAPTVVDDGFVATVDVPLTVAAPGVLANDADEDGDALTVVASPVSLPSHGSVTMGVDGSFTYTPAPGFTGTDTFTYRASDGAHTTDGTVILTVTATPPTPFDLYLRNGDPASSTWGMGTVASTDTLDVPDYDGDGNRGVTIAKSKQDLLAPTVAGTFRDWTYAPGAPLALDGPVTLDLWSTVAGFDDIADEDWSAALFDCDTGTSACDPLLVARHLHVKAWNGGQARFVERTLHLGSVQHTVAAGHELRLRVMVGHRPLWIAMTGDRASTLTLTPAL